MFKIEIPPLQTIKLSKKWAKGVICYILKL